jgi:hypothetical protein
MLMLALYFDNERRRVAINKGIMTRNCVEVWSIRLKGLPKRAERKIFDELTMDNNENAGCSRLSCYTSRAAIVLQGS